MRNNYENIGGEEDDDNYNNNKNNKSKIDETDVTVNNPNFTFNNFSDLLNQTEFDNWR